MRKSSMKNKMAKLPNTKFKWSDYLVEDLLKAPSNFKTALEFQNKDFNAHKPRQYKEVDKQIVKINERYVEYFGPVSLPLFPSDMDVEEEEKCIFKCCKQMTTLILKNYY